jgi:hypothetical protein
MPSRAASLERSADRPEVRPELGADALYGGDDRERDTGGNQAIFDGGCTRLVGYKSADGVHAADYVGNC